MIDNGIAPPDGCQFWGSSGSMAALYVATVTILDHETRVECMRSHDMPFHKHWALFERTIYSFWKHDRDYLQTVWGVN